MSIGFFQIFKVSVVEGLEKTEIYSDTNVISSYILRETEIQAGWFKGPFACTTGFYEHTGYGIRKRPIFTYHLVLLNQVACVSNLKMTR